MNKAVIIAIGDELLIGQTVDTNSVWIAQQLNGLGITVERKVTIPDHKDAILKTLDQELKASDFVIITGGLGPTSDDITKPTLCEFFGGKMIVSQPVLDRIQAMLQKRKRPSTEVILKQAEVPDVCTVLPNSLGTAPGMWFEKAGKVVISLPGVPYEMIAIMEEAAIPELRKRFVQGAVVHRTILTAGEGESNLAAMIPDIEAALPAHIKLAYLPSPGIVRLRLTATGNDELSLIKETELYRDEIANRLEQHVIALEDLPLEHLLGKALTGMGKKLGLAESCTGGYIAHKLTQIMGSAGYFQGSIVCYQESVKEGALGVRRSSIEKYGVVSEEVALEMAHGARKELSADIGFGITGLLSGGGTDEVAVGTICMAVDSEEGKASKTYHFHMDRLRNKELAVQYGLLFIWRFIHDNL